MKRNALYLLVAACGLLTFSCTGVRNMSSTLSKTGSGPVSRDTKHGDYLSSSAVKTDTIATKAVVVAPPPPPTENADNIPASEGYRRDYGRLTDSKPEGQPVSMATGPDANQKIVNQYVEMDKLGELVLYEIDVVERRYTKMLTQFKTANSTEKETISRELDKLNADQLLLYKTYTTIYKNGKTDWEKVKSNVQTVLLNLRGVDQK